MALRNKIGALTVVVLSFLACGNVFALQFDGAGLDADGTFHVNMAPPKNMTEKYALNEMISEMAGGGWGITAMGQWNCNDEFTKCKLAHYGSEWTDDYYDITYVYDEEAETLIDDLMDSLEFPEDGFFVSDLDYLKYIVQAGMAEELPLLPVFSSGLKTFIGNRNLDFAIDVRMGGFDPLMDFQGGMAKISYNGTLYGVYDNNVMVYAPHIFYVETDAENYVEALKARIVDEFGEEIAGFIEFDEELGQTVREFYATECANDEYCEDPAEYFESYEYLKDYLDSQVYGVCPQVEVDGQRMGICYNMIIVADSSKVVSASGVNSTDLLTDVNIMTEAKDLPGDAMTYAEALGSDDEGMVEDFGDKFYAYELGLRSSSLDSEVSESEDGFTVSVPVPAILEGMKAISAYWKNHETGELEEHRGQIVGDMVVFGTSHFSTYVLAESTETETNGGDSDGDSLDSDSEESDGVVVPGAPDTGVHTSAGLGNVVASLPVFGVIMVLTGVAAFAVTRKR